MENKELWKLEHIRHDHWANPVMEDGVKCSRTATTGPCGETDLSMTCRCQIMEKVSLNAASLINAQNIIYMLFLLS